MRLFAAVVPPASVLAHLEDAVAAVPDDADLRWTATEARHLTLAFYGEVPDETVSDLEERLERAARRSSALELRLAGAGRFDGRVLWMGCAGDVERLRRLAQAAAAAGRRAGVPTHERRPFRPHVTLARCRRPVDLRPQVAVLAAYEGPAWSAETLSLVRSHLGAGDGGRPRYETLAGWQLGSGA